MRRIVAALLVVAGALVLAGCPRGESTPAYPDDAIRLRQNVPTEVGDHRLVAINLSGDNGIVVVEPPEGTATNVKVTKGQTYDAAGLHFTVVDVVQGEGGGDAPGAGPGTIVVTVG